MLSTMPRTRRVDLPAAIASDKSVAASYYTSAFRAVGQGSPPRTAEEWARSIFEAAPAVVRRVVSVGWRRILWLRLGPASSPVHVLGWPIVASSDSSLTLEAKSPVLTAQNILLVNGSELTWVTVVDSDCRLGRWLWTMAAPIHHLTIRLLLDRAAAASR
jgi:hypothetical protein